MSFIAELRRRNVFRVAIAYALGAWVLLQIVDFVLEVIAAPDWILQVFFLAAAVGLPVVLIFSWVFEVTPEGIKRESQIDRSASITPHTASRLDRVIIVFLSLAVLALLVDRFVGTGEETTGPKASDVAGDVAGDVAVPPPAASLRQDVEDSNAEERDAGRSVAVLPFVNMSSDPEQEYFSDGISEELLNVLVRVDGLRVPSRTSSFTFKGSNKKVAQIGRELQVDHVLEGSVRKSGNRIRVTAQLIDVNTDTHLWSETYTRELDDIFEVQDDIARAIVGALKITLSATGQDSLGNRPTANVDAYNRFLLGRHLWNQRTRESLLAAVEPLSEAVAIDPQFEPAWAALADTYALIPEYGAGAASEYVPLGLEAAESALAIKPDSARALTARAYLKSMYQFDMAGAEADYRRAVQAEPGYATGHQWYGEFLATQRRTDEALQQLALAADADPLSAVIAHVAGWIMLHAGRLDDALAQYEKAIRMNPQMPPIINNFAALNMLLGNYERARELTRLQARLVAEEQTAALAVIDALENPALKARALDRLSGWQYPADVVFGSAFLYALLEEYDLALGTLERGFEAGDPYITHINRMVVFDPLRENPRFQALLRKMNLWQE